MSLENGVTVYGKPYHNRKIEQVADYTSARHTTIFIDNRLDDAGIVAILHDHERAAWAISRSIVNRKVDL